MLDKTKQKLIEKEMSKMKGLMIKKIAIYWAIWFWKLVLFLLIITIVTYITFIIIAFISMLWWKSDASTSLTYYEWKSFYGMPYNASFTDGKYNSIFSKMKSLSLSDDAIQNELLLINTKIQDRLNKTKVEELYNECWEYCDNRMSELFSIELRVLKEWELWKKFTTVTNYNTWKKNISYLWLKIIDKKETLKKWSEVWYTLYVYDLLEKNLEDNVINDPETWESTLFLHNKWEVSYYNESYPYAKLKISHNYSSIIKLIEHYFLSKNNFIDRIYNTDEWIRNDKYRSLIVETTHWLLTDPSFWIDYRIIDLFSKIAEKDNERMYNSAVIDMMNFSWIKSPEERNTNLSNQFLLSKEKINLEYFNKIEFWKDYKNLIITTKNFKTLDFTEAKKILTYNESTNEHSDEVWVIVKKDIKLNLYTRQYDYTEQTNSKDIVREWNIFYSPTITYWGLSYTPSLDWKLWWNCDIVYPQTKVWDYVTYQKEALYTGQQVKARCKHISTEWKVTYSYHDSKVPALIEEVEVTFYKKFIFDNENKKSFRKKDDYFLNYFYDKEYINKWNNKTLEKISMVNNIYLDRESIIFKWIYLKVKWFGIEVKDDWKFITAKKSTNWYSNLLPDAPIKFEFWILTDLNSYNAITNPEWIPEIKIFESNNKIENHTWNTPIMLDKQNYFDKNNSFFSQFENALYKNNKINSSAWDINVYNFFIKNKNKLTTTQKKIIQILYERELLKQKNSYFYTMVQDKKFLQVLDTLYNIKEDSKQSDIFKKYLVLFSDITTNKTYNNLLNKKYRNTSWFKNSFNENYSNIIYDKEVVNISSFDKCYSYQYLNDSFNETISKNSEIAQLWIDTKDLVEREIVIPCYNKYLPFKEAEFKINTEKYTDIEEIKEKEKELLATLKTNKSRWYINNPLIYKPLVEDDYIVSSYQWNNNNQIFSMFEDKRLNNEDDDDLEENEQRIIDESTSFMNRLDNREHLFELYKESKEYQESCDKDTERLLKHPVDKDFKCSLYSIYDEFLNKVTNNEQVYTFIKEEYLKELVQDEPFYSYYNMSLLDKCDWTICSVNRWNDDYASYSSSSYVPLEYNDSPYKKTFNFFSLNWSDKTYSNYSNVYKSDIINDYTYFFDLNKSFSFEEENFLEIDDNYGLHKISLNPNIYLHSFIRGIKDKSNKYQINVYWNGFKWVNNTLVKKDVDKEIITDLNTFLLNHISNKKVISDLKTNIKATDNIWYKLRAHPEYLRYYNIIPAIESYSKLWTDATVNNNLINYIDNIKLWNILLKITWQSLNREILSNYDVLVKNSETDSLLKIENNILDKYFYSIYVINLLENHYNNNNVNIENNLLNNINNLEDIKHGLSETDDVAWLYKDVLLYTWGYMSNDDMWWLHYYLGGNNPFTTDTVHELLWKDPTTVYKLSKFYDTDNPLIVKAVAELKKKDYKSTFIDNFTKKIQIPINWDVNNLKYYTLNSDERKIEKVLMLKIYYNDFFEYITEREKELKAINQDTIENFQDVNTNLTDIDTTNIDLHFIIKVITTQHELLELLQSNFPWEYYKYYLQPLIEWRDITDVESLELKNLYDRLKKDYNIETSIQEYISYMNIIKNGLKSKNMINTDYKLLPLKKIDKNYEFNAEDINSIDKVRNLFLNNNDVTYLPTYNIIADLFWTSLVNNSANKTITVKYIEKLEIDKNILLLEKADLENKLEEAKWSKWLFVIFWFNTPLNKRVVAWIKKDLKKINNKILTLDQQINNLSEEEKNERIKYNITLVNNALKIEKLKVKKQDINKEYKSIFFKWPFNDHSNWFIAMNYGDSIDTYLINRTINSYIWMSFILHNLRTTEDWIKNIVDELSLYTEDINNKEIGILPDFKNIWNFAPYYLNNGYASPNWNYALKFELILLTYGNETGVWWYWEYGEFSSDYSILSIQDKLNKDILDKRFENLKTTYCTTLKWDSKQQTCREYMDYLQSLNPSTLKWELEYITTVSYMKSKWIKRTKHFINETYSTLAKKFSPNSVQRQELGERALTNSSYIGQCTWYVKMLKNWSWENSKWQWYWNWNWVYASAKKLWYPTDFFYPKVESKKKIMSKIQVWDIISFQWRNSQSWHCITSKNTKGTWWWDVWHVAIIVAKNIENNTITIAEANVLWVLLVDTATYDVSKLCNAWLVHNVDWRY